MDTGNIVHKTENGNQTKQNTTLKIKTMLAYKHKNGGYETLDVFKIQLRRA